MKLLYLRDAGPTEIGGFGISAASDLLLLEDIQLVRQHCSLVTVQFEDSAVADFFDDQVDQGRHPERFGRVWVHTHPGNSPLPSGTDEATFARCFGGADWSVMFILASGGEAYVRLRLTAGPGASLTLPLEIDFGASCPASDFAAWEQEYLRNVLTDASWEQAPSPAAKDRPPATRASERLSVMDDHFLDPARFDPWEQLHERIF